MTGRERSTVWLPDHGTHREVRPEALYFGGALTLVTSVDDGGAPVVRPFSACCAVGTTLLLGLNGPSSTRDNLRRSRECVVNLPQVELAPAIRAYTRAARSGVPGDGFDALGLTAVPSERVRSPRVRECYVQLEARVVALHRSAGIDAEWAELAVVRTHAVSDIVGSAGRIDAARWRPLVYSFAELFGLTDADPPPRSGTAASDPERDDRDERQHGERPVEHPPVAG